MIDSRFCVNDRQNHVFDECFSPRTATKLFAHRMRKITYILSENDVFLNDEGGCDRRE